MRQLSSYAPGRISRMFASRHITAIVFLAVTIQAYCASKRDPWQSVRQLPHNASFIFMELDRSCQVGEIKDTTDTSVIVHIGKSDVTIERSKVLRILRGTSYTMKSPNGFLVMVYSGRSSWADIMAFVPFLSQFPSYEIRISVDTTGGKVLKGNLKEATDAEIVLRDSFGKETRIPKNDVSRVTYICNKPLSDAQEYDWEELAMLRIFDPVLYPRMFHVRDTLPVRIYDRAIQQDDSPAYCR